MAENLVQRRQALLDLRRRFRHLVAEYDAAARVGTEGETTQPDMSPGSSGSRAADAATPLYDRTMAATLRRRYVVRLADVEAAIRRLEAGTYGRCVVCQRQIAKARLDAVIDTPFCIEHAASQEVVDDHPDHGLPGFHHEAS